MEDGRSRSQISLSTHHRQEVYVQVRGMLVVLGARTSDWPVFFLDIIICVSLYFNSDIVLVCYKLLIEVELS